MLSEKKTSLMSQVVFFFFNNLEITPLERRRIDHRFLGARDSRDKQTDVTIKRMSQRESSRSWNHCLACRGGYIHLDM